MRRLRWKRSANFKRLDLTIYEFQPLHDCISLQVLKLKVVTACLCSLQGLGKCVALEDVRLLLDYTYETSYPRFPTFDASIMPPNLKLFRVSVDDSLILPFVEEFSSTWQDIDDLCLWFFRHRLPPHCRHHDMMFRFEWSPTLLERVPESLREHTKLCRHYAGPSFLLKCTD